MMDIFKNVTWFVDKVMMLLGYLVILTWMSQYKLTIVTLVIFVGLHAIPWAYDKQKKNEEITAKIDANQGVTKEEIARMINEGLRSAVSNEDVERVTTEVME